MAPRCDDLIDTTHSETHPTSLIYRCIISDLNRDDLPLDSTDLSSHLSYLLNNQKQALIEPLSTQLNTVLNKLVSKFDIASNMWLDYPEIQNYSKLLQLLRILSATRSTEQLATLSEQIITTVTRMIKIQRLPQIDESIMNPFYHLLKHTTGLITTHSSSNESSAYTQSYSLATALTQLLRACQENTHCDVASLDQTFTMLGTLIGYLRHSSAYSIRCASLEAALFSFLKALQDSQSYH